MDIERLQIKRINSLEAYRKHCTDIFYTGELISINLSEDDCNNFITQDAPLSNICNSYGISSFLVYCHMNGSLRGILNDTNNRRLYFDINNIEKIMSNTLSSTNSEIKPITSESYAGASDKVARADHVHSINNAILFETLGSNRLRKITAGTVAPENSDPSGTYEVGDIYIKYTE